MNGSPAAPWASPKSDRLCWRSLRGCHTASYPQICPATQSDRICRASSKPQTGLLKPHRPVMKYLLLKPPRKRTLRNKQAAPNVGLLQPGPQRRVPGPGPGRTPGNRSEARERAAAAPSAAPPELGPGLRTAARGGGLPQRLPAGPALHWAPEMPVPVGRRGVRRRRCFRKCVDSGTASGSLHSLPRPARPAPALQTCGRLACVRWCCRWFLLCGSWRNGRFC